MTLTGPPSMESWAKRGRTELKTVPIPGGTPGGSGVSLGSGWPGATRVTVEATAPQAPQRYVALTFTSMLSSPGPR